MNILSSLLFYVYFSVRFMLGGDNGKFKYGPQEGHSPAFESLLPKEKLLIRPCYQLGDPPKGILQGPPETQELISFVPRPVETSQVRHDIFCLK